MLPGALKGGTVLYPLGVEAVPPFVCPFNVYGVVVLVSGGR